MNIHRVLLITLGALSLQLIGMNGKCQDKTVSDTVGKIQFVLPMEKRLDRNNQLSTISTHFTVTPTIVTTIRQPTIHNLTNRLIHYYQQITAFKAIQGLASPEELITAYRMLCLTCAQYGTQCLEMVKAASNDAGALESLIRTIDASLKAAQEELDQCNLHIPPFSEQYSLQDMAIENYYKALREARDAWNHLADCKTRSWIRDFEKLVAKGMCVEKMVVDCIKNLVKEKNLFKQAVYKRQLEHAKEYKLKNYRRYVADFPLEKLQKELAISSENQTNLEKDIKDHKHTDKKYAKECPKLKSLELGVNLEQEKQKILRDLITKKAQTIETAKNSPSRTSTPITPSAEKTKIVLSDSAREYVQKNSISQETVTHLGADCIEDLAGLSQEISNYPDLLNLSAELERVGMNPLDMTTGNDARILQKSEADILSAGIPEGLAMTTQDLKNLGSVLNEARILTMAFLHDPVANTCKFGNHLADAAENMYKSAIKAAHDFKSQFKGDYVQLNTMLAKETQTTQACYRGLIGVFEKTGLSSKTIELLLGTDLSLRQLPDNLTGAICQKSATMWHNFNQLSDKDKVAAITHQVSTYALCELGIGTAAKSAQLFKTGTNFVTKAVESVGEAVSTVARSAKSGEKVVAASIGEITLNPGVQDAVEQIAANRIKVDIVTSGESGVQSGLPNSMFRQGEVAAAQASREIILPRVKTFEQARNKALEIAGDLGPNSRPYIGTLEKSAGFGKITGRISADNKVRWYLDYDPQKGLHFNVHDFRLGKGTLAQKYAIPFEGTEEMYTSLLKHFQ